MVTNLSTFLWGGGETYFMPVYSSLLFWMMTSYSEFRMCSTLCKILRLHHYAPLGQQHWYPDRLEATTEQKHIATTINFHSVNRKSKLIVQNGLEISNISGGFFIFGGFCTTLSPSRNSVVPRPPREHTDGATHGNIRLSARLSLHSIMNDNDLRPPPCYLILWIDMNKSITKCITSHIYFAIFCLLKLCSLRSHCCHRKIGPFNYTKGLSSLIRPATPRPPKEKAWDMVGLGNWPHSVILWD